MPTTFIDKNGEPIEGDAEAQHAAEIFRELKCKMDSLDGFTVLVILANLVLDWSELTSDPATARKNFCTQLDQIAGNQATYNTNRNRSN